MPFKRYVDEQRKAVLDGIAYLKRVATTAINTDEPLLATSQAIDKVFAKYRSQAYSEEKVKFDEQIALREEEEKKLKEEIAELKGEIHAA